MPLIALSAATLPLTVNGLFTIIALATNLEAQMLRINIINGAISLALNLVLIPVMGPTGSAVALLLAAVVGLGQGGELLRREGMLTFREGAAAVAPAALWTGLATVGAVVVELGRLSWPVTALALIVSCGGLVWSYRAVAAVMLRPAARWLQRTSPKS
jgi:peptidoglycan biosynthesis protein MviN/MurJ (putative lipid II flippase)